jgi:hypothetical protein
MSPLPAASRMFVQSFSGLGGISAGELSFDIVKLLGM